VSHLHLPDGLLPVWLWLPALAVVVLLLVLSGRTLSPRRVAYQGALGAMMLAAMSVPLGPLDYHLALAGPVGVLLGPAAAFQVVFVVTAILAFLGHGGFTAIGLNTLLLAGAATGASLTYAVTARRLRTPWALAVATAVGQTLSGLLWFAIVGVALRTAPHAAPATAEARLGVMTAVVIALWLLGVLVESVVAWGIGRFLARVRPGLLPGTAPRAEEVAWST
jgi:cobalt/nickel transport system permease protein